MKIIKLINNEYKLGITMGIALSIDVVLTNVVFPGNGMDNGWEILIVYLFLFFTLAFGGYIAVRNASDLKKGAVGGAVTAFISVGMVMLTFFIIDNLYIDIVSKQPEKIWAFNHQDDYNNMRDFINHGLLRGLIFVLPIITAIGAGLGLIGAFAGKKLFKKNDSAGPVKS